MKDTLNKLLNNIMLVENLKMFVAYNDTLLTACKSLKYNPWTSHNII